MVWARSAEAEARRLFGNTSGWRKACGIRRVRLRAMRGAGTEVFRGNQPGCREGEPQRCSVAFEREGARSIVGGFGEKCRDRKRMARFQHGGLGGKGRCQSNKAIIASAYGWDCLSRVYRCRSYGYELGRRWLMSRVVGWWYDNVFWRIAASQLWSQVRNKGGAPAFVGLGTNVHGWS